MWKMPTIDPSVSRFDRSPVSRDGPPTKAEAEPAAGEMGGIRLIAARRIVFDTVYAYEAVPWITNLRLELEVLDSCPPTSEKPPAVRGNSAQREVSDAMKSIITSSELARSSGV
jgi:hypothetical protein